MTAIASRDGKHRNAIPRWDGNLHSKSDLVFFRRLYEQDIEHHISMSLEGDFIICDTDGFRQALVEKANAMLYLRMF